MMSDFVADRTWDAVVVGAGPAGAMAAREIARLGASVLLVERKRFPREKVCGSCLNPWAIETLRSVGLEDLVADAGDVPLREMRLGVGGSEISLRLPGGAALSRAAFDQALVDAARRSGVVFLDETTATVEAVRNDRRVVRIESKRDEAEIQCRVVILAAGIGHRCLKHEKGIETRVAANSKVGAGCHIRDFPDHYGRGTIFMAVGRPGYVGLVRIEDGSLNVAAAFDPSATRRGHGPADAAARVLAEAGFPPIPSLASAAWRGTGALTRRTRPLAAERLFMIGDATGYVEPFTGEGMGWALAAGKAVAPISLRAQDRWEPSLGAEWAETHRRLVGRRQRLCRLLAGTLRSPLAVRAAAKLAKRIPRAAEMLSNQIAKIGFVE